QQYIEQSIRPGDHVAYAAEFLEHRFLRNHLAAVNFQPQQFLYGKAGNEEIVLPARITVAAVEADAAGRQRGRIKDDGLIGIGRGLLEDARLQSHRGETPAVIVALV